MTNIMDAIRNGTRAQARVVARWLDKAAGGRVSPAMVTVFGLVMHLPIAWLIAVGDGNGHIWAAVLLVFFGLFDVLDGALAKEQGTVSVRGMLLDASTDRMKEAILYTGVAYALASGDRPADAVWAAAAAGASICVSYVKAKGEAAVASSAEKIPHTTLNRMFADGLMTFEVRMAALVAGLLTGQLVWAVAAIAVLAAFTSVQRLVRITRALPAARAGRDV